MLFGKASLQGIVEVFDQDIYSAIRKDVVQCDGTLKAAVTMDFPSQGLVDCLMSLAVCQSNIQRLAMALFKLRVGSVGGVRYIVLKGGLRLIPSPEIILKGVLDDDIRRVFGSEIYNAIATSRMRKKELEEGHNATECVSMILRNISLDGAVINSLDGAIINLSLGLKSAVQIKEKMYK